MDAVKTTKMRSPKELEKIEWMKSKLGALWSYPKYCGLCMETRGHFYPLKMEFAINECYSTRPLAKVVSAVLGCDIEDYTCSTVVCVNCTQNVIQCYIFIENTKKVFTILGNCVNNLLSTATDLHSKLDDICDENSKVMIVLEYDETTNNSVNEIITGNNTILTDKPIIYAHEEVTETKQIPTETKNHNKEIIRPIIIPTQRVVKYPRTKPIKADKVQVEKNTPTVSLEGGKIVIVPLTTNVESSSKSNIYKCESCSSIFSSYRMLKEHEKSLHNTTIYQCRFCSKKYNSQQYLDDHYVAAHLKSRCRCCHCLVDNKELNKHLRETHEKLINCCKLCDLVYYSFEKLETHYNSAHCHDGMKYNTDKIECVMCLRWFRDSEMKFHKCKFSCLDCSVKPCIHYKYLMSYREQVLSHAPKVRCLDCDYMTKRKEHLIAHVNREHLDYHPFTCNDCKKQFYTKLSLKTHIVQFHQDLKCQYCDKDLMSLKLLETHRKVCKTMDRLYNCVKCVASFSTENDLNKHTKLSHSDIVFPCTLCNRTFTSEQILEEHHIRVHNAIQYKKRRKFIECTLCDITFQNIREMLQHEEVHNAKILYPCKVCPKSFPSLKKVYIHKQQHYTQKHKCPGCKKSVTSSYFNLHKASCVYLKQPQNVPYVCELCGDRFITETLLSTHLQLHSKMSSCKHCNKLIKPSAMRRHIEADHPTMETEKEKQFKCDRCEYIAKKKFNLENHVNKIHLKIKPYICEICSKEFCGKSRLDEHINTHTNSKVCFCTYCGKKFANKVCLKMHTRRHTGEKPYQCNICMERFRSSSMMKTHRLKKHQDKTIQCPLCDSMYHLAAEMRFHVKKVHWKRSEPFNYKEIISEEYHHLFRDRRLQKLGEKVDFDGIISS